MKKILITIFVLLMFMPSIFYSYHVEAKTIAQLRKELSDYEEQQRNNNENIARSEEEIQNINSEISSIYASINTLTADIANANAEINRLNEQIEEKNEATKKLMASLQLTDGDSFYLEYLFGAETISDFIYRYSLTEQITNYNENLINEMNDLIKQNEEKKVQLESDIAELGSKQTSLQTKLNELKASNVKLYELGTDLEDEIANTKTAIQMYLDAGCGENDDVKICASKTLPADTKFWRPTEIGYITSDYGYRDAIYSGGVLIASSGMHEGIDISNWLGNNCKLYAIANGKIAAVWYDIWGGNQLTIHHNINGVTYSSSYAHMSQIFVSVGDIVTKDTVVGMMGSTGSATGPHLHIAISTGLRFNEYSGYNAYVARTLNPVDLINFPSYEAWYDRYTKYD